MARLLEIRPIDGRGVLECGDCRRRWEVRAAQIAPGVVHRCPHCGGSFVPRYSDYLRIRDALRQRRSEPEADVSP